MVNAIRGGIENAILDGIARIESVFVTQHDDQVGVIKAVLDQKVVEQDGVGIVPIIEPVPTRGNQNGKDLVCW